MADVSLAAVSVWVHSGLMSNQYVPLGADKIGNFFDSTGQPLGARSQCPTCGHAQTFNVDASNGKRMLLSSTNCGHAFEVPTPQ